MMAIERLYKIIRFNMEKGLVMGHLVVVLKVMLIINNNNIK